MAGFSANSAANVNPAVGVNVWAFSRFLIYRLGPGDGVDLDHLVEPGGLVDPAALGVAAGGVVPVVDRNLAAHGVVVDVLALGDPVGHTLGLLQTDAVVLKGKKEK